MIISGVPIAVKRPGKLLSFTYSGGTYDYREDGQGNWELRLLSNGVLTMNFDCAVDIFAVGGGGSGGNALYAGQGSGGGGGGGGYTTTVSNYIFSRGDVATANIGAGGTYPSSQANGNNGGTTKMFTGTVESSGTTIISAEGGKGGKGGLTPEGGNGGSGGGSGWSSQYDPQGNGGSNGNNGGGTYGGTGQHTSTRAFGVSGGELFSGGGGGGGGGRTGTATSGFTGGSGGSGYGGDGATFPNATLCYNGKSSRPNTGGGGGGGAVVIYTDDQSVYRQIWIAAGAGSSGIILIRNHQ